MVDWLSYDPLFRYFHILSGITWIGLLYFFNFVNLPLLKFDLKKPYAANMAEKASAHITIKALFFFRWGAFFTLLFGLLLVHVAAVRFGGGDADYAGYFERPFAGPMIGMGILLALVMFINVWFVIWPNQQVILGNNKRIADGATPEDKARMEQENAPRLKNAVLASRANTWLSVPMLFGMVYGAHGEFFDSLADGLPHLAVLGLLLVIMGLLSQKRKK